MCSPQKPKIRIDEFYGINFLLNNLICTNEKRDDVFNCMNFYLDKNNNWLIIFISLFQWRRQVNLIYEFGYSISLLAILLSLALLGYFR